MLLRSGGCWCLFVTICDNIGSTEKPNNTVMCFANILSMLCQYGTRVYQYLLEKNQLLVLFEYVRLCFCLVDALRIYRWFHELLQMIFKLIVGEKQAKGK